MLGRRRPRGRVLVAILFTDVAGSTDLVARVGDEAWARMLAQYRVAARRELQRFRGTEVDAAGDGFFALFEAPAAALGCAVAIRSSARSIGLQVRSGVHAGEVELEGGRATGLGVHIASRIQALARADEILASATARDLAAGSGFAFEDRGDHELRGVPGTWRLAAATPAPGTPSAAAASRPRRAATARWAARWRPVPGAGIFVGGLVALIVVALLAQRIGAPASPGPGGSRPAASAIAAAASSTNSALALPTAVPTTSAVGPSPTPPAASESPVPLLLGDGLHPSGRYVIAVVPGRPEVTLADEWKAFTGDSYESLWVADRPGNRITLATAVTTATDACGTTEKSLLGDPAEAMLAWLRANAALEVGPSVVRGSGQNASTQVDVNVVADKACPGTPASVRIVTARVSPPGITILAGPTTRLLIHALAQRVLVIAVQAPTAREFEQFLPQADAVLSSLAFEAQ